MASVFSGVFVLISMLIFSPYAAYVPRAALAGVLIIIAYGMIDRAEIARIWRGARPDAAIMIVTFLATLLLPLEFAVLSGILLSFGIYVMKTSVPRVSSVLPDEQFRHFTHQVDRPACPQLAILDIHGDLYFGAVNHIETAINKHLADNPEQRYLLLRLHSVAQCDFSGVHALESIARICQERGGDLFLVRVHMSILEVLRAIGFRDYLGKDHFLSEDEAIAHLFHKVLDPAVCIYECDVRAFKECQNLPRPTYPVDVPHLTDIPEGSVAGVSPEELWRQLCSGPPPLVIDVREPREFGRGHVPQAQLIPLPELLSERDGLPQDRPMVLICRAGRRSTRAAYALGRQGYDNVQVLRGGLLAWEASGLLAALDECD
jgi:SulP family sulfate permease